MILRTTNQRASGLVIGVLVLAVCIGASIVYGYTETSWSTARTAFVSFDNSNEHIVIQSIRLPRALIATLVGASLAVSGVLMQVLTKNPLASPSIFGISSGAGFFIVLAITMAPALSISSLAWVAFVGASLSAILVYIIGSLGYGGLTPLKLTLAGAAIAAAFSSLTQGILVLNETALNQVLYWLAGSVQGRDPQSLYTLLPYIIVAGVGAQLIAGKLNILRMGDEVAKGLGLQTGLVKAISAVFVVILAGSSVAIAGPIGFIGIMVPHLARGLLGSDHRWVIPYSALLGSSLLLLADIGARFIIMPQEVPVGIMTAFIGAPFFIYIARRGVFNEK